MEINALKQHKDVLIVAFSIVLLDISLIRYFAFVYGENQYGFIIFDLFISIIAVFLGKRLAAALGFPIWKVTYDGKINSKNLFFTALLGVIMVAVNVFSWSSYSGDTVPWANFNSFYEPILVAMRAALTEQLFFRLLLFSLIGWIANKISKSKIVSIIIGAILSSILFALYHQGFYFAFIYGILLCCIYKRNGLVPAMIIHFLSDVVPFVMIYLKY